MKKEVLFFILFFILLISGCITQDVDKSEEVQEEIVEVIKEEVIETAYEANEPVKKWQNAESAIDGNFADADVVKLDDNTYRIYYGIEPEVPGNNLEIYSAKSTDGKKWEQESGVRRTQSTFPDVVKSPDGKWRMYFQQQSVIKSAISDNGLTWKDESGLRIDTSNSLGFEFTRVAAPTTIKLDDGVYLMVYSGTINEIYNENGDKVPNNDIRILMWATSVDGLKWDKKGIALDTRNPTLEGFADGPDLVKWDNGTIRLYFWSYRGIYYSTFNNERFSEPIITFEPLNPQNYLYPSDPPGDPTLIKINDIWYMYYGIWKNGIFYTTLE